jgi:UDP-GlcNAc:undecaprenyl-phosphate GlcNAc-1-phosphate transferase
LYLILTLGCLSILMALVLTPIVRDGIGRFGFLDHPDGVRKQHATPIPRVGGIAIVVAYVATFAIAFILPFSYTFVLRRALPSILQLAMVASVVFLTGVLDDLVGLSAWQKLMGIGGAGALAYVAGIRVDIHLFHFPAWPWLGFVITVIWLIGCANAFNLIDGMDGLAAGVGLVATLAMLVAALTQGNMPLALATMPLAGCLLGFLRYNFNPASVFLGDSGSLLIGFLLGCYGALWSEKSVTLIALTAPLLALSIPLLDVLLSVSRRYLRNRPIFQADRGHIHHKLLERGFSPKAAVLTIYGCCSIVAILSLLMSALHSSRFSGLIVIAFCAVAWFGIRHLEYGEFAMAGRMFLQGRFRRIIDSETKLLDFEKALGQTANLEECWKEMVSWSREFGFQGVQMNVNGTVLEDFGTHDAKGVWELRIPLPEAQYVTFFRDLHSEASTLVLSAFVDSVQRGLLSSLKQASAPEPEVVRIPAAAELYYTARAAAGGVKLTR